MPLHAEAKAPVALAADPGAELTEEEAFADESGCVEGNDACDRGVGDFDEREELADLCFASVGGDGGDGAAGTAPICDEDQFQHDVDEIDAAFPRSLVSVRAIPMVSLDDLSPEHLRAVSNARNSASFIVDNGLIPSTSAVLSTTRALKNFLARSRSLATNAIWQYRRTERKGLSRASCNTDGSKSTLIARLLDSVKESDVELKRLKEIHRAGAVAYQPEIKLADLKRYAANAELTRPQQKGWRCCVASKGFA